VVGFLGKIVGQEHMEDAPGALLETTIKDLLQAGEQAPFDMRLAMFFNDYGVWIGIVGIAIILASLALSRR
jgi:hypothetical protein